MPCGVHALRPATIGSIHGDLVRFARREVQSSPPLVGVALAGVSPSSSSSGAAPATAGAAADSLEVASAGRASGIGTLPMLEATMPGEPSKVVELAPCGSNAPLA